MTALLPTCVILGAQKAGTTFVKLSLAAHPDADVPRGECPFFEDPHYDEHDLGPLVALFEGSTAAVRVIKRPDYLAQPVVADRIHRHLPDARLIAVIRHPVDRAVSAYFHFVARGLLPLRSLDAGMRDLLAGDYDARFPVARDVLEYGFYGRHLQAYTTRFSRQQLHIVLYEHLRAEPDAVVGEIERFLGLDPRRAGTAGPASANESIYSLPRLATYRLRTRIRASRDDDRRHTHRRRSLPAPARWANAALLSLDRRVLAPFDRGHPALADDLRASLLERYREDTALLEGLLDRDLGTWKR